MCALRGVVLAHPSNLATTYRLSHGRKSDKNMVQRCKPLEDMTSLSSSIPAITVSDVASSRDEESSDEDFFFGDDENEDNDKELINPALNAYFAACKQKNRVPMSCVKTGLLQEVLSCKFTQLQMTDLHAICVGLCLSYMVKRIVFENNNIGEAGASILGQVVQTHLFIREICITENNLRSEGAYILCEAVKQNEKISLLDLSGNNFVEDDGKYFKSLLDSCHSLRNLNLSHNCLSEKGVKLIAEALAKNSTLISLELSWNHIRLEGAKAIGDALKFNSGLERLNLAWNGLHLEGAEAIGEALAKNDTLTELDLTCNRMSDICVLDVIKGLENNQALQTLRVSRNQITSSGALAILTHLKTIKSTGLTLLDFGRQEVHDTFEKMSKELLEERGVTILYGIVWLSKRRSITSFDICEDEAALLRCNPLTVLMECMRLQNFRLVDYFKYLDTNKSNMICINELCEGMMKLHVPINRDTLMKLLHRLDKDKNSMLDFSEMMVAQQEYKKKWRQSMAADVDFDKTDVGKVSMHLRKIMGKKFVMKHTEHDALINTPPSNSRASSSKIREMNKTVFEN